MRIKKLLALALAGTMVFCMTACGDKESKGGNSSDASVDTVLEKFEEFTENMEKNYSSESNMEMKMSASGMSMDMKSTSLSSSYDGVTYTKTTTSMLGIDEVEEEYSITNEDGSVTVASKSADDDEWEVDTIDAEDIEEAASKLDIDKIKDSAKMETKGDNCIVTMEVDAEDMDMADNEMFEDMADMKITVIVTYNTKDEAITEMEIKFDLDALSEAFGALGDVEIEKFEMKVTNIKKNDKPIEIPSEIELD